MTPDHPNIEELRGYLWTLRERLPMFTVYDHPDDHPEVYVARLWLTLPVAVPMPLAMGSEAVEPLQDLMVELGLTKLMRSEGDDPKIVETWL